MGPKKVFHDIPRPVVEEVVSKVKPTLKSAPLPKQESEDEEEEPEVRNITK